MFDTFTSEQLIQELPRPLLNFLWYLWELYGDSALQEFRITVQSKAETAGQQFAIPSADVTITQNFGCALDAEIAIRKISEWYFMEYY
jgi:hypothetical protein